MSLMVSTEDFEFDLADENEASAVFREVGGSEVAFSGDDAA